MTALQKINLGTPPSGGDGDTTRTANTKTNSNVDVLNAQAALTSAPAVITAAEALTAAAHVGKRVNINLAAAGAVSPPAASTCAADSVILLRNLGATVVPLAPADGSGDTVALSELNPGESALLDTDGVHTWNVLMRGRSSSDDEAVNGTLTTGGSLTVSYPGAAALVNDSGGASKAFYILQNAGKTAWQWSNASISNVIALDRFVSGTYKDSPLSFANSTGVGTFTQRPMFAGNTPWDSGNLTPGNYAPRSNPTFPTGLAVSSNGMGLATQGAYLLWSETSGSGATSLVCNAGTGAGGFVFRTINAANTVEYGRVSFSRGGDVTAGGMIIAGGSQSETTANFGYLNSNGAGLSTATTSMACGFYSVNGAMANQFWATSDARVKTDVTAIAEDFAVKFVKGVTPVSYYKGGADIRERGFIAQDVMRQLGGNTLEMVNISKHDGLPEHVAADGFVSPEGLQFNLNYDEIIPIHATVLRSILRRLEKLEAKQ